MEVILLGTGGAWGVPELYCECRICQKMRERGERRSRTSFLVREGAATFLVDCGPDVRAQLERHPAPVLEGVFITHEHADHYIGLDELFIYKRLAPRDGYAPIPLYVTAPSWEVIRQRFGYLADLGVVEVREMVPGRWFEAGPLEVLPFKTYHGRVAAGSVGLMLRSQGSQGGIKSLLYTSDFMEIPEILPSLVGADVVLMQSFWLNEPVHNRPCHMSFQRALGFLELLRPAGETVIVHIGDADMVPGDPANRMAKKYEPKAPLRPGPGKAPYPIPCDQVQWQETVDQILSDHRLPWRILVGKDGDQIMI